VVTTGTGAGPRFSASPGYSGHSSGPDSPASRRHRRRSGRHDRRRSRTPRSASSSGPSTGTPARVDDATTLALATPGGGAGHARLSLNRSPDCSEHKRGANLDRVAAALDHRHDGKISVRRSSATKPLAPEAEARSASRLKSPSSELHRAGSDRVHAPDWIRTGDRRRLLILAVFFTLSHPAVIGLDAESPQPSPGTSRLKVVRALPGGDERCHLPNPSTVPPLS
jgi:hypothetical protein